MLNYEIGKKNVEASGEQLIHELQKHNKGKVFIELYSQDFVNICIYR